MFVGGCAAKQNACRGLFHDIDEAIQECIVSIAIEDAPRTRQRHIKDLEQQATARIIKEKALQKSMEDSILMHSTTTECGIRMCAGKMTQRMLQKS
jgi:hypothetical protein